MMDARDDRTHPMEQPRRRRPAGRLRRTVDHLFGDRAEGVWQWLAGRDVVSPMELPLLVNKEYYDDIDAKMARLKEPTVGDAIQAAYRKGNVPYYDFWPHLGKKGRRPTFSRSHEKEYVFHEIMHLAGRFAHTMQGEHVGAAFEAGLRRGCLTSHSTHLKPMADWLQQHVVDLNTIFLPKFQIHPADPATPRDVAIYLAAGMYLREKIDAFERARLIDCRYDLQKKFCDAYAGRDHVPEGKPREETTFMQDITYAPYALIKLSREEWRAITAVATGLAEPEQTPYPQRLTAIKQALVHAGLMHDMKPAFEKAAENHEANIRHHNAKVTENYLNDPSVEELKLTTARGFDAEKHHAARVKRSAPASFAERARDGSPVALQK